MIAKRPALWSGVTSLCLAIVACAAVPGVSAPTNVYPSCTVDRVEFSSWQSAPGIFKPAKSTTFTDDNQNGPLRDTVNCDFFKWGAQMFLWLTTEKDGKFVFNGPDFLDVIKVPDEQGSHMEYVAVNPGGVGQFAPRNEKNDDDRDIAQAGGGGVVVQPNRGIVFYGIKTNDVFAYYQTGVKSNTHPAKFEGELATNFPTDDAELAAVTEYARKTFKVSGIANGIALAMELKTSWVPAASLRNPQAYIRTKGRISTFRRNETGPWEEIEIGGGVEELALIGFHVVGSVQGHPEMVWATFEHKENAPQNGYAYYATKDTAAYVPYDGNGSTAWLLNADPHAANTPVETVDETAKFGKTKDPYSGKTVKAILPFGSADKVVATKVVRINPWGDQPSTSAPNKVEPYRIDLQTPLSRTTDLLSLAQSLDAHLGNDVRANYVQVGSIWSSKAIPFNDKDPELRGTLFVANATMETFHQYPDANETGGFKPINCFGCHGRDGTVDNPGPGYSISHLFEKLIPLVPTQ